MTRPRLAFALAALWPAVALAEAPAQPVPRHECFPVERLAPALRPGAEALILRMLDSEALYTVVGGLKPMSSSFWTGGFSVEAPDLSRIEEARVLLSAVRCGEALYADVLLFARAYEGKKMAHAFVVHRPSLDRALRQHRAFFDNFGLAPGIHPLQAVLTIEHARELDRLRGSGYLFGFPDAAVDFFVAAEGSRRAGEGKAPVPRDFLSAPTYSAPTHKFVWAVPKGRGPTAEDSALIARAGRILAAYRARRELYIGPGRPGVVALLRDWFDDGTGRCAPEHARLAPPSRAQVVARAVARPTPQTLPPAASAHVPAHRAGVPCRPGVYLIAPAR